MRELFLYNWQIREDWFQWCKNLSPEELTKKRVGGMGSFLHNLYHVIDCEQIWVNQMFNEPVIQRDIKEITNLNEVIEFSNEVKKKTISLIEDLEQESNKVLQVNRKNNDPYFFPYEKVALHICMHEVHHIGQLSVWAREINRKPVSSDILFRKINLENSSF
ncbi:putative damage-inducible protein DinB OS=Ureibacillus acetophenoni OX=614649 GN=SAMN05877842_11378 PE=3 SV=1 [Ureibacillus acetophenoni]